jgi:hypothetical protein
MADPNDPALELRIAERIRDSPIVSQLKKSRNPIFAVPFIELRKSQKQINWSRSSSTEREPLTDRSGIPNHFPRTFVPILDVCLGRTMLANKPKLSDREIDVFPCTEEEKPVPGVDPSTVMIGSPYPNSWLSLHPVFIYRHFDLNPILFANPKAKCKIVGVLGERRITLGMIGTWDYSLGGVSDASTLKKRSQICINCIWTCKASLKS